MRIFDAFPAKRLAKKALSQAQMNGHYAARNPLYLPFRMQLVFKQLVYSLIWGGAFPILYLLTFIFLSVSVVLDESSLLRT